MTAYLRTLSFATAPVVAVPAAGATTEPDTDQKLPLRQEHRLRERHRNRAQAAEEPTVIAKQVLEPSAGPLKTKRGPLCPLILKSLLRGYEHSADPNTGAQEVFSQEGTVNEDGSFVFEDVEIPRTASLCSSHL